MSLEVEDRAARDAAGPKAVVRRLIEEVINAGRVDRQRRAPAASAGA